MVQFALGDLVVPLTGIRKGLCGYVTKVQDPQRTWPRVTVTFPKNAHGSFLPKNLKHYDEQDAPEHLKNDLQYQLWAERNGVCRIAGYRNQFVRDPSERVPSSEWTRTTKTTNKTKETKDSELPSGEVEELATALKKMSVRMDWLEERLAQLEKE